MRWTKQVNIPRFVLKDVCAAFGEQNYRRVSGRLEEEEKGVSQIATPQTLITVEGREKLLSLLNTEKGGIAQ